MEETKKKVGLDLTEGNVFKLLMIYVLPLLLANFLQQLYNSVDTMIIGHFVGSTGTVGVSVGGEIAVFITYFASAFGSAGQIYIAQICGAGERKKIKEVVGTELIMMMSMALVATVASLVFCDAFLRMMNTPAEAWQEAKNYMMIVSLGLPAVFGYNAVCGVLRGMGESKMPLLFIFISAVVNIILDLLFVAVIPLSAAGTAIATVAAEYASFIAALLFMKRHKEQFDFDFKLKRFTFKKRHFNVIMRLGIPYTVQNFLIHATQLYGTSQINSYGLIEAATYSIGNRICSLISMITYSVSAGAGAMVGQCLGARKIERAKKVIGITTLCTVTLASTQMAVMLLFPKTLAGFFTQDKAVIEFCAVYLKILCIAVACSAFSGAVGSVVSGTGFAELGFLSGILDGIIIRIGLMYLMVHVWDMGVLGYFYVNAIAHFGPFTVNAIYFLTGKWKTRRLLTEEKTRKRNEALLAD